MMSTILAAWFWLGVCNATVLGCAALWHRIRYGAWGL